MTREEMEKYESMVEMEIATAEELNLARNLMSGTWNEVLDAVSFIRTGYKTWEQFLAKEMEDWEEW